MIKRKPLYQTILEILGYILFGCIVLGTLLDTISNAFSLLNLKISIISTVTILILWITTSLLINKQPIKWLSKEGMEVKIKKLGKKINFGLLGIIIFLWIPPLYHSNNNIPDPNITEEKLFSDSTSFHVLLIPFGSSQFCNDETILCERELKKHLLTFKDKDSLNIEVSIDYSIKSKDKIFSKNDLKDICNSTNAHMIIWGDYNQRCNWDSTKIQINYFLTENDLSTPHLLSNYKTSNYKNISGIDEISSGLLLGDITNICYWTFGLKEMKFNNFTKALYYLQKIEATKSKEYSKLFHSIALCYQSLYNYNVALHYYTEAIRLDSTSYLSYNNRGNVFVNLEEYNLAFKDFEKVINLAKGNFPDVYNNRGYLYREIAELHRAVDDFNSALIIWSKQQHRSKKLFILISTNRGITLRMAGFKDGIDDIERALKEDVNSEVAIEGSITYYFLDKEYVQALKNVDRLLEINPKSTIGYVYSIKIKELIGNNQNTNNDKEILKSLIGIKGQSGKIIGINSFGNKTFINL